MARRWPLMVDQVGDLKRRIAEESGSGSADLPEARGAIAARLGMTPETLSRSLHALERAGLIRSAGRRIDVPDRERLLHHGRASG